MHSCSDVGSWCVFVCGYIPPLLAVLLILGNVAPYYYVFLPKLWMVCVQGEVSWLYFAYCHAMMALAEILVFVNLFFAVGTSPGYVERVPWSCMPVVNGHVYSDNLNEVRHLGLDGRPRFCLRCEIYKPDNAHHCRRCRRCIYRMDHHCPWINNCVGRDNGRFFFHFLLYIPLGAFHIAGTTAYSCLYQFSLRSSLGMIEETEMFISIFFSLGMGVVFFAFAASFVAMTFYGNTTISNASGQPNLDKRSRRERRKEFLDDVFGPDRRWFHLICPVHLRQRSTGTSLETLL